MKGKVLITGGTGLIGSRLTELLQQHGYEVSLLSRRKDGGSIRKYLWDVPKKFIEEEAIKEADYIVNLAGAGVMDHKWTKDFKREIVESRTHTIQLLKDTMQRVPHHVKAFISASAIGYYGFDTGSEWIYEEAPSGEDFLAEVVKQWEEAAGKIETIGIRTVKLRIGIVLSRKGGALERLMTPIRMNAGAVVGSGKQYISWIHMEDICGIILKAIENESMSGVYNAVSPAPVTNDELMHTTAHAAGKTIRLPNIPSIALKFMLGSEKAAIVTGSSKISSEKIQKAGYTFLYPDLKHALENLIK